MERSSSSFGDASRRVLVVAGAAAAGFAAAHLIAAVRAMLEGKSPQDSNLAHPSATTTASSSSSSLASPTRDYAGRVVLVTGASSGIGASAARLLASRGASLAVHFNRGREEAESVARECRALGSPDADVFGADLSDPTGEAQRALFEAVVARFGAVHVLVNNAGVYEELDVLAPSASLPAFARWWDKTIRTNLTGPALLTFLAGRHMAARRNPYRAGGGGGGAGGGAGGSQQPQQGDGEAVGAIVFVGSRGAYRGEPRAWAYGSSKAGLHHLAQSAAWALGPSGVSVSAVAPGFVSTPMAQGVLQGQMGGAVRAQSPWGRVAEPREVADAVAFLGRYWENPWVTGGVVDLNGASYLRS
jgi:3-oxoacyl-[acyl-carrier protein] reductase